MDGAELCRERYHGRWPLWPLGCGARAGASGGGGRQMEAGAHDCLRTPVSGTEIRARVHAGRRVSSCRGSRPTAGRRRAGRHPPPQRQWQGNAELGPGLRDRARDSAVAALDGRLHGGQPKAAAGVRGDVARAVKTAEDVVLLVGRDAHSGVGERHRRRRTGARRRRQGSARSTGGAALPRGGCGSLRRHASGARDFTRFG
jgi:hypothetical protein